MTTPHTPVQQALSKLRTMSADEETRYWAEAREKALRDEVTLLEEARIEKVSKKESEAQTARAMLQAAQGQQHRAEARGTEIGAA